MENQNYNPNPNPNPQYTQPVAPPPVQNVYVNNDDTFHTGIMGWIGWLLLGYFLPLIGLIIALCAARDKSVKHWAAAQLIVGCVIVVIVIVVAIIASASAYSMLS